MPSSKLVATFSFTDHTVQEYFSLHGQISYSGNISNADNLRNVAASLLDGALSKSSSNCYTIIFKTYKEFLSEYLPLQPCIPANLEMLTMFIAHCFIENLSASTVGSYL